MCIPVGMRHLPSWKKFQEEDETPATFPVFHIKKQVSGESTCKNMEQNVSVNQNQSSSIQKHPDDPNQRKKWSLPQEIQQPSPLFMREEASVEEAQPSFQARCHDLNLGISHNVNPSHHGRLRCQIVRQIHIY